MQNNFILPKLSDRELDVIKTISNGYRTQEIAEILSISPGTVKVHRKNIMRKMNTRNCISVVSQCIKLGLI